MLLLITGTPGAGKTLFTVTRLIKEINDNPDRTIYSDITGLKIDGVLPAPDDWRDAKDGSLIIYDECHFRPMFQKDRGRTKYQAVKDLTTHRHRGLDIWFVTQSPNFLHSDLLALIGEHIHLDRPMGAKLSNVYKWRTAQEKPNGVTVKRRAEDTYLFKYNKEYFKYYKSVDVDDDKANHKKLKIPTWRFLPLLAGLIICSWAFYSIAFNGIQPVKSDTKAKKEVTKDESTTAITDGITPNLISDNQENNQQTNALNQRRIYLYENELPKDYEIRRNDPNLQIRGVAQMGNKCTAYNTLGDMMTLSQDECKSYVGTGRVYKSDYVTNGGGSVNVLPQSESQPQPQSASQL